MLTIKISTFILLSCLLISACSNQNQRTDYLFNIDSVIQNQIHEFIDRNATVRKKVVLNGVEKITTIQPKGGEDWNKELAIFLELDIINRPINRNSYKVEDLADLESNLRIKSFTATEDLPVKYLRIYYHKNISDIRKIEAAYNSNNSLYSSGRLLMLEFEDISGNPVLTSYSVDGGQKMFLDDSVQYTIDAGIAQTE
jgi:hypothetical protein